MKILALDLGKFKSVYVMYLTESKEQSYGKIGTNAREVEALLRRYAPDRLVIEAGAASGWVSDLAESLKLKVQVANGNDERWRWKVVKSKTDRSDALKLAQLGVRHDTWMRGVYEEVRRGSDKRKKIAIVAVARRLLVKLWAMLRDGTPWKEPAGRAVVSAGG